MYDKSIAIYKSQEYHGLYSIIQSCSGHVTNQQIREEANIKTINTLHHFIATMNYKYNT
jgi:hypothetical protein